MSRRSPAVKRIMQEAKELAKPTDQYYAAPLEDNIFEWHFTIRGPPDTPYENGRYHGRIILPVEYPLKPPNIVILTPNGRFEVGTKICLTISAHHPESWQPSWSIRTVLMALISFLPTEGKGAIGAVEYPDDERRRLARKSRTWKCDVCKADMGTALCSEVKAKELSAEDKKAMETMHSMGFAAPKAEKKSQENEKKEVSPETNEAGSASLSHNNNNNDTANQNKTPATPKSKGNPTPSLPRTKLPVQQIKPPPVGWGMNALIFGLILAIFGLIYRKYVKEMGS
eukprot:m.98455 g.98455  ORF g.98455 m.98455 type:complete len:284 (-) comp13637_c1_seq4:1929-2780(-)